MENAAVLRPTRGRAVIVVEAEEAEAGTDVALIQLPERPAQEAQ